MATVSPTPSTPAAPKAIPMVMPSWVFAVFLIELVKLVLLSGLAWWAYLHLEAHAPSPGPAPVHPSADPHFVAVGKTYLSGLGKVYADAWESGAKDLDAGKPLTSALATVGKAWDSGRADHFDKVATPEFVKVIPQSVKDADVTPAQRAAMAAAWRGFATGLGK